MALRDNDDDDDLTWPFRGRFDVAILNQINDSKHYMRRIVFDHRCPDSVAGRDPFDSWGYDEFINYGILCKTSATHQYVKDNIMCIKYLTVGLKHRELTVTSNSSQYINDICSYS